MQNQISFEQKIKSFTAKEIVEVMIKGLENEWVKVDTSIFGRFENGICYGCAATNAVCEIMQKPFVIGEISGRIDRARAVNADSDFLFYFENAIDCLRSGEIESYNAYAKEIGMTLLPEPEIELPWLTTAGYKEDLKAYKQYASNLPNEKLK